MKTTFFGLLFFLSTIGGFAQRNQFTLNSYVGTYPVKINGKKYSVDSIGIAIATNYPRFDTLIFLMHDPESLSPILCNFKPDSLYSVTMACCGMPDLVKAKPHNDSLDVWKYPQDEDKIRNYWMDKPYISIRTKDQPKDSIYAYHQDFTLQPELKLIGINLWRLGVPRKGHFWNNITTIQFFKTDPNLPPHKPTDFEEFLGMKNIVLLGSISFRLFDDQRFVIIYDETTNTVSLAYE